jgi:hypothetical protein
MRTVPLTRTSRISYQGFDYTVKESNNKTHHYRCSKFRSANCKGVLKIDIQTNSYTTEGIHTCRLGENTTHGNRIDIRNEMRTAAIEQAIQHLDTSPKKIWESINSRADDAHRDEIVIKEFKNKIINLVKSTRKSECGTDTLTKIEMKNYSLISETDPRPFLITSYKYLLPNNEEKEDRKLHSMLMWAHPDLISIMRRHMTAIYIDCTFRCVPKPYTQCLIAMIYDDETDLYVPAVYILLDNKSQWTYWHALHFILVETETKFNPLTVTTDFEQALLNAVKEQLPNAHRVGCLFHFKQAIRRRMQKLHIPEDEISSAMKKGVIDELTTLKRTEIDKKIKKLKKQYVKGNSKDKWTEFFNYFANTWMKKYAFDTWNVSNLQERDIRVYNRTNNALEAFNRTLGGQFSSPNPNLLHFIQVIKKISIEYAREITNIKLGISKK